MVMEDDVAKIGDLGIAKLLNRSLAAKTQIGTPHYMPPEIWKNRPYSFTSDSWAMGCILYEMAALKVIMKSFNLRRREGRVAMVSLRLRLPPPPTSLSPFFLLPTHTQVPFEARSLNELRNKVLAGR